jgi:4-hydroxythreonine-4-phosphate dehydrogenase
MSRNDSKPLALTMGDPAGIGLEITLKAWEALRASGPAFFVIADPALLRRVDASVPLRVIEAPDATGFAEALPVMPEAGGAAASIERATALAMAGEAGGIVTNPVNKKVLYDAGFAYPGHTEFLAALTGAAKPVMLLACPKLRVVPVTIHVPLAQAIAALSTELIVETARITEAALRRDFGISAPRLAIAGLNPHAGEGGAMGDEEARIIAPAIEALRKLGMNAAGPFPPDTMFTESARDSYDVALGMYHDQVLIPLKTLDVHNGVNVTLGVPIIRTSPDHGTAYDIAGTGSASPSSLIAAIRMAGELAERRARGQHPAP